MKFDHPIITRMRAVLLTLAFLLVLGLVTRPVEAPAWKQVRSGQPELNLAGMEDAVGQGIMVGMLGGFRSIIADFLWLQANLVWQKKERAKFNSLVRLVTAIDPRPEFFWINSARMIAYDVPHWRIQEEGGYQNVPEFRKEQIDLEQAERAFEYIQRGLEYHPDSARLYLEIGQIYMIRLDDPARAAPWFLRASRQPNAPHFAARIYAELLKRQGKNTEAYEFLKGLYGRLSYDDPYAHKGIILERIRELEETLAVPPAERFQP